MEQGREAASASWATLARNSEVHPEVAVDVGTGCDRFACADDAPGGGDGSWRERPGRLLGQGSGYLLGDDREAVGVGEGRGWVERDGAVRPKEDALMEEAIEPTTPARRCARAGQPLFQTTPAGPLCRRLSRADGRSRNRRGRATLPRARAHGCPPPCHRLESLEESRDGERIIELHGDVGGADVDEDGHIVERPVGHLTTAMRAPRDRFGARQPRSKSRTALYSSNRECEADCRFAVRSLQVSLGEITEVMADGRPTLREHEDLGFGGTSAAKQLLVNLAGPIDGLAVPTPYDFNQPHAEEAELTAQGKANGEIEQGDAAREPLGDGRDVTEGEIGECDLQLRQRVTSAPRSWWSGERTELDRDLPALRDRGGLLQRERAGVECLSATTSGSPRARAVAGSRRGSPGSRHRRRRRCA